MALKFAKKAPSQPKVSHDNDDQEEAPKKPLSSAGKSKPKGLGGFLKRGKAAKEAIAHEEAQAELRKQERGKLWRFYMKDGEDRRITFLDGDLDDEGMLDINMLYEHMVRLNGNWENFVCTADVDQTQPCPICESGDRHAFVGVFTVIDHTEHTIMKGPNAGKVVKNQRKLFVAKQTTLQQLTKLAAKRGGLAGCTFDVSRTGDKSAAVGSQFDFDSKYDSYEEMAEDLGLKLEDVQPANYEEELRYRTPEELIELGVGKKSGGIGYEKGISAENLKDEL